MDLTITEKGFDHPRITVDTAGIGLQARFGGGQFLCYSGKGFSFWHNQYSFSQNTQLQASGNVPVLELHITRRGVWQGSWEGIAELDLYPGQFNLSYTPHVKTSALFRGGMAYRSCDIHFEQSYLEKLTGDFASLDGFLKAVTKRVPGSLSTRNHACTREMTAACEAILDNPFAEAVQPYILSMKVREILIAALEKVAADLQKPLPALTGKQKEGLLYARGIIEDCLDKPPSLQELSKQTGMNECVLKRGFRELFGISPYQYFVKLKMEKAKLLLLETREPISSIAYFLGYSQPSSFGHEFRKAIGMSPGQYRDSYPMH